MHLFRRFLLKLSVALHMGMVAIGIQNTQAAILAYDGFAAGGATPDTSQYHSTGGHTTDALAYFTNPPNSISGGQNPITYGFTGAWSTPHNTASTVYARAQNSSLNYQSGDGISLITTNGSASLFRSGTNATPPIKSYERNFNITSELPKTLYFSVLVSFTSGQPIQFQTQSVGGNFKSPFGFGIDSNGFAYVNIGSTTQLTEFSLATGETHLLVMKVVESANPLDDNLYLYVDPDLGSEGLNTSVASLLGDFYVAENASYSLNKLTITGQPNNGSVVFDEFKVSTDWSDIASAVPEPGRLALLGLFIAMLVFQRNRKHT